VLCSKVLEQPNAVEKNIIYLWSLRMLIICGGYRKFVEKQSFNSDDGQRLTQCDDDAYLLETIAQDTNELRWWLLGFGSGVEVLEPSVLREDFRRTGNKMATAYEMKTTTGICATHP